jgi:hypothetical protein
LRQPVWPTSSADVPRLTAESVLFTAEPTTRIPTCAPWRPCQAVQSRQSRVRGFRPWTSHPHLEATRPQRWPIRSTVFLCTLSVAIRSGRFCRPQPAGLHSPPSDQLSLCCCIRQVRDSLTHRIRLQLPHPLAKLTAPNSPTIPDSERCSDSDSPRVT